MNAFGRLELETAESRNQFLSIPIVTQALSHGVSRELYLDFLIQAYHHVKHTSRLMALASVLTHDERYQDALVEYMNEERGHEKWILDDIRAIGGDPDTVACGKPGTACQVMIGYAYYAIQWISPYAVLGMVHVLEGLSVILANKVADAVQHSLGGDRGLSYLRSHGALDVNHIAFFKTLVNGFEDRETQDIIIETARVIYRLYGAIFEELGLHAAETHHAA